MLFRFFRIALNNSLIITHSAFRIKNAKAVKPEQIRLFKTTCLCFVISPHSEFRIKNVAFLLGLPDKQSIFLAGVIRFFLPIMVLEKNRERHNLFE